VIRLLLLTDDDNGKANYNSLSSEGNQPVYIEPIKSDPATGCTESAASLVGRLAWRGNRGGLAFRAPSVPLGSYYLFMETQSQCWRIGGTVAGIHGPLVLSIGATAAEHQDIASSWSVDSLGSPQQQGSQPLAGQAGSPQLLGVLLAMVGAVVLATVVALAWWLRHRQLRR
jgi:hypothetical protein